MDIPFRNIIGHIDDNLLIVIGHDLKINIYEIKGGKILYLKQSSIQNSRPRNLQKLKNNKYLLFNGDYDYLKIIEEIK